MRYVGLSALGVVCFASCLLCVLHSPAGAQIISVENSYYAWHGLAADGAVVACPAGDGGSYVSVHVRDADNEGVEGVEVELLLYGIGANYQLWNCPPMQYTDEFGDALIIPHLGIAPDVATNTACPTAEVRVIALPIGGVVVNLECNGIPGTDYRQLRSYDLDGNGVVNGNTAGVWGDYAIFAADFMTPACRSDFNGDGIVNLMDFNMFTNHAAHPALVVEPLALPGFGTLGVDEEACNSLVFENWGNVQVNWQLTEACPWLTLIPPSGTIPAPSVDPPDLAARTEVNFCVNTAGLADGYYECEVLLTSTSPYPECVTPNGILVEMTVGVIYESPSGVTVAYSASGNNLSWSIGETASKDAAATVVNFRVYRSTDPDFVPDSGNMAGEPTASPWFDAGGGFNDYYKVSAVYDDGSESSATSPTSVSDIPDVANGACSLFQNSPNPFNPQTAISFDLPKQTAVSLRVFDVSGRLVAVLLDAEVVEAGHRKVVWNGQDDTGQQVAAGVYFYRLDAGEYSETKRMALVK